MSNVLVVGVFDLFHSGHVELLRRSRALGDRLIVLVNDDRLTTHYKRRPIMEEHQRLAVVQACRYVDAAFIARSLDIRSFLLDAEINMIVHGDDWNRASYLQQIGCSEEDLAQKAIELVFVPYTDGISTSAIIARCASASLPA